MSLVRSENVRICFLWHWWLLNLLRFLVSELLSFQIYQYLHPHSRFNFAILKMARRYRTVPVVE